MKGDGAELPAVAVLAGVLENDSWLAACLVHAVVKGEHLERVV
jgi:hypothetical protein